MASSPEGVLEELQKAFPGVVKGVTVERPRRLSATITPEGVLDVCRFAKEKLGFEHISSITGVDYKTHLSLIYHLWSYSRKVTLALNLDLNRDNPKIQSITPLWGGANWHEREAYDLLGVIFENHPNLQRILTPPGFEYHPLRKEFKIREKYKGRR